MPTSTPAATSLQTVLSLVNGQWSPGTSGRSGTVYNPSHGTTLATVPYASAADAAKAVEAAHAAFAAWTETPVVERVRVLYKFRELLMKNFEALRRPSRGSTARRWSKPARACSAALRSSNSRAACRRC
ncbi:MAG: aldehyde dehydrogenase family protein [Tepidisphaeraceae bacterium]